MIIDGQESVTTAVLSELKRAPDPRLREIMSAFVRHLHDFAREVRLTEAEFERACAYIATLGQKTTPSHNEVVLMAGSLGFSTLICLLNNGNNGQTETAANMLGPFWRLNSPRTENGASIVRSPTPGEPIFVTARVEDPQGRPVAEAEVDVWQASSEGFYENQDPGQAEMNLRGRFTTDAQGCIRFRSVKPAGYPIPIGGPVGDLLRAQGRHNMRPAHIHFLIHKPGYKTQCSQVYTSDDPHLETDVQFGVTQALIGNYVRHADEPPPAADIAGAWHTLEHRFVIEPGEAKLPRPPISAKASGERPVLRVLNRRD
jgi:hydroxyquinol 1,2-dioxygenase